MEKSDEPLLIPKPYQVEHAVKLIYGSLGIGLIKLVVDFARFSSGVSPSGLICNLTITFAIIIFLTVNILQGKNWARIIFTALFVLGTILFIPFTLQEFSISFISGMLSVIQAIMQLVAIVFLFQSESSAWFKREK